MFKKMNRSCPPPSSRRECSDRVFVALVSFSFRSPLLLLVVEMPIAGFYMRPCVSPFANRLVSVSTSVVRLSKCESLLNVYQNQNLTVQLAEASLSSSFLLLGEHSPIHSTPPTKPNQALRHRLSSDRTLQ